MAILESRTKTGISWVKEGMALFKQTPRKWLMLALAYVGIFMMLPSLPGFQVFALVTFLIWPIFIVIAIRLYKNADERKIEDLPATIRFALQRVSILMLLGVVCLAYGILVSVFLNADIQILAEITQTGKELTESQLELLLEKMPSFLLKLTLMLIPLMMATWFSPMLIAFNGYSLAKAIKSSIAGSLQYLVAMTAAWLLLTTGIVTLLLIAGVAVGIVGAIAPAITHLLMQFLVFGCLLLATALMLAFQYVSYRDVFKTAQTI